MKTVLILVLPAVAAVLSVVVGLWSAVEQAQAAGRSRALFDVGTSATTVAERLQAERVAAIAVLSPDSKDSLGESYGRRIAATDEAITTLVERRRHLTDVPSSVAAVLARVDADLRDLDGLRSRVRGGGPVALSAAAFGYRITIADLIGYRMAVAQSGVDAALADQMRAGVALAQAREAVGLQQVAVLQAMVLGRLTPTLHQEIVAARAFGEQSMREFAQLGRPAWRALAGRTLTGVPVVAAARAEGTVAATGVYQPVRVPGGATGWSQVMTGRAELLAVVESAVDADIGTALDQVRGQRLRDAAIQGSAVGVVLAVAFVMTVWVARSLVERLRTLEAGALRVARTELPDLVGRLRTATDPATARALAQHSTGQVAVDVAGRDEVGQVAEAFNAVHAAAVDTAAAEARLRTQVVQMITSVARRVQTMTARVLTGLEVLEKDEADPDRLAAVFGVDHDATRLRRYAASLLVVAGGGPGQSQSEPVALEQLINGALSEVEGYQRVELGMLVEVLVDPQAVDGLVHILAELLDNATSFSSAPVRVSAGWHGQDLLIRVTDTGIGLTDDDLRRLNTLVADPGVGMDVFDQMGLVVVSKLATGVGARVWLEPNPAGGVIATILVPAALVTRVVYLERRPLTAALTARPELSAASTGWDSPPASTSARPVTLADYQQAGPAAGRTIELPPVTQGSAGRPPSAPTHAGQFQPEPVDFHAGPWPQPAISGSAAPASAAHVWRPDPVAAQPETVGTTTRGLPIRHPGAHAIPDTAVPSPAAPAAAVDPGAVRAQVSAVMRSLHAAAR